MRPFLLTAGLAALSIALAVPALAEDSDCGLLCRITGYLGTDHMAAAGDGAAASGAKPHRAHAAVHKASVAGAPAKPRPAAVAAAPPRPAATASAKPAAPAPVATAARAAVPVATKTAAPVKPTAKRAHAVAPPALVEAKPEIVTPREAPRPSPVVKAATAARPRRIATAPVAVARAGTLTAAASIPGSAPAMPASFQPFASR